MIVLFNGPPKSGKDAAATTLKIKVGNTFHLSINYTKKLVSTLVVITNGLWNAMMIVV